MSTSMLRRQLKNIVQNFSEAEIKVREATSNDPWGPSSSLMAEISDLTYNVVACSEIMTMVWKRLNDSGKNWRHVYKAMTLLDYLLKTGSDRVAQQCNENIYVLQTLREFQFIDRDGKDQGVNVREKAKQLVTLLKDEEKLKEERAQALKTKEKMAQTTSASSTSPAPALSLANRPGGLQLGGVASLIKAPESQAAGDETKSKEEADQAPQTEGGSSNLWGAPAAPADSSAPPAGSDPWGGPTSSPPRTPTPGADPPLLPRGSRTPGATGVPLRTPPLTRGEIRPKRATTHGAPPRLSVRPVGTPGELVLQRPAIPGERAEGPQLLTLRPLTPGEAPQMAQETKS
ncbi:hypothetical protein ANANG_G00178320 [Anguilla anguilla]|uniref:ENTH domain-containing protein n=1 Tax=Anguilla anguilla TaxID=7936 RepID=A0A9D3RTI4_ANGAN|nr:hypothetical protein ANANG_G00178320 [Anguilla anguilla]